MTDIIIDDIRSLTLMFNYECMYKLYIGYQHVQYCIQEKLTCQTN